VVWKVARAHFGESIVSRVIEGGKIEMVKDTRTRREKIKETLRELVGAGVLPTTCTLICLWTPIAIQNNIVEPCWDCHDFEAAAVHEIGHILGLNHPNLMGTVDGFPIGNNSYNTMLASNEGVKAVDLPDQPEDLCYHPLDYVEAGAWPDADDLTSEGVRNSIMEALTEHNPKVCLQPDDIEGLYNIYPRCDGRGITVSTEDTANCFKSDLNFGWVRVLVYIALPIMLLLFIQLLCLSGLNRHREEHEAELVENVEQAKQAENKAHKRSVEANQKAVRVEKALEEQIATEEQRVEQLAQERAAKIIQNQLRKRRSSIGAGPPVRASAVDAKVQYA